MNGVVRTVLTSTPTDFCLHARLDAYENEKRLVPLHWDRRIPRHHV
jgi:hypothetical protein